MVEILGKCVESVVCVVRSTGLLCNTLVLVVFSDRLCILLAEWKSSDLNWCMAPAHLLVCSCFHIELLPLTSSHVFLIFAHASLTPVCLLWLSYPLTFSDLSLFFTKPLQLLLKIKHSNPDPLFCDSLLAPTIDSTSHMGTNKMWT